jgi:kinesin family protein 4/21/27
MLHKLQNDISIKEELVHQLEKTQDEYTVMRDKYENRMSLLQETLMAVQRERDLALNRKPSENPEEKKRAEILKIRYEEKMKKLNQSMSDLKRKSEDANKMLNSTKNQNEALIKGMKESIDSLKGNYKN